MIGYGVPGRLPLIVRFFDQTLKVFMMKRVQNLSSKPLGSKIVNSISQWRTFILVNFSCKAKVHALTFPCDYFFVVPPF